MFQSASSRAVAQQRPSDLKNDRTNRLFDICFISGISRRKKLSGCAGYSLTQCKKVISGQPVEFKQSMACKIVSSFETPILALPVLSFPNLFQHWKVV